MLLLPVVAICWGVSNFFMKLATGRISSLSALGWETIGAFIMALLIFSWERKGLHVEDRRGTLWAFCGGIGFVLGGYLFLKALSHVKLSIAMPFSSLNILVSALLGVLILGERLGPVQLVAACVMIFCAMLLGALGAGK